MIYIVGDTHGMIDFVNFEKAFADSKLNDTIIIVGDFGFIWNNNPDTSKDESDMKQIFNKCMEKVKIAFLPGNHENFERLYQFPIEHDDHYNGQVRNVFGIKMLQHGHIYTIENKSFFVMGGATSIDKNQRIDGISWWREEIPSYMDFCLGLDNLDKVDWKVDVVLTHSIFKSAIPQFNNIVCPVQVYLDQIKQKLKFDQWYFGHFHIDIEIEQNVFGIYRNYRTVK